MCPSRASTCLCLSHEEESAVENFINDNTRATQERTAILAEDVHGEISEQCKIQSVDSSAFNYGPFGRISAEEGWSNSTTLMSSITKMTSDLPIPAQMIVHLIFGYSCPLPSSPQLLGNAASIQPACYIPFSRLGHMFFAHDFRDPPQNRSQRKVQATLQRTASCGRPVQMKAAEARVVGKCW